MAAFTFAGIPLGSQTVISADQNGLSASGSVAAWGQGMSGSFDISVITSGELVAPAGLWFEAINLDGVAGLRAQEAGETYDPAYHQVTYKWTFGDGTPEAIPELNMPGEWKDVNTAWGPRAAHVFQTGGAKVITCSAYFGGQKVAERTITLPIEDSDQVYTNARTILVDPAGAADANYPGAVVLTALSQIMPELGSRGAAGQTCRVLFKRGVTWNDATLGNPESDLINSPNVRFGAYGSGDRPVFVIPKTSNRHFLIFPSDAFLTAKDFTFSDLHFQGDWDTLTERGVKQSDPLWMREPAGHYVIHNCGFDGFNNCGTGHNAGNHPGESTTIYSNCHITNFSDFGIYTNGNTGDVTPGCRLAILGCDVSQTPEALDGGPKNGFHNSHGCPVRVNEHKNVVISASSFFVKGGWSSGPARHEQPSLRLMQGSPQGQPCYLVMDRVAAEGGIVVNHTDAGVFDNEPMNGVFDKVLIAATARTIQTMMTINFAGMSLRNIYGFIPAVPAYNPGNPLNALFEFGTDAGDQAGDNENEEINVYNCTLLSLRDNADENSIPGLYGDPFGDEAPAEDFYSRLSVANSFTYQPNHSPPDDAVEPIDLSLDSGFVLKCAGVNFGFEVTTVTLASAVNSGTSLAIPYSAITDQRTNQTSGSATSQAYWQGGAAGDIRHKLAVNGEQYHAEYGDFTVSFADPSNVVIQNTSGDTWAAGANFQLKLDRTSRLGALDATYSSAGQSVPLPRPVDDPGGLGTSSAIGTGDPTLKAYDDLRGDPRPISANDKGALLRA